MPSTADLFDQYGDSLQSCQLQFREFGGRAYCFGKIRTLKIFEDNALIKECLSSPASGEVLVIDGGGSLAAALVGDVIAGLALKNGWSGLIIRGAVRDSAALSQLDLSIKALGSNPRRSTKLGGGHLDVPVGFGQVQFPPGWWLYSDEDGILVSEQRL